MATNPAEETKTPKQKKVDTQALTLELLGKLVDKVDKLADVIAHPITSQAPALKEQIQPGEAVIPTPQATTQIVGSSFAVPTDYRKVIDEELTPEFDLLLEPMSDAPLVTATIVVPDKYSNRTAIQKEMLGNKDIRPKVITIAGGNTELREWAKLVFRNLSPEAQMTITAVRNQLAERRVQETLRSLNV